MMTTVRSATVANLTYLISTDAAGRMACSCKGFMYRSTCRHIKELAPTPTARVITNEEIDELYG